MHVQLKRHREQLRERRQHAMRAWRASILQPHVPLNAPDVKSVGVGKLERLF